MHAKQWLDKRVTMPTGAVLQHFIPNIVGKD
jgi:hypothetical protein